jgi:hypothetical protein
VPLFIATDHQQAELSGDLSSLRDLRARLAEFLLGGGDSTEIRASQPEDSAPFPQSLSGVKFLLIPGPAKVTAFGSLLEIQGSRDNLQRFSTFLSFENPRESHHHFEHVPGNPYVAQDSLPLIVSCHDKPPNKSFERTREE